MGKKSRPPPAPDYTAAAQATAQGNWQNALNTSNINRFNESGPMGSVGWTLRPGADPTNPQPGDYIRQTTLAPGQQQLFDQQTDLAGDVGQWAGGALESFAPDAAARDRLQESLYARGTQFMDRRFGRARQSLESQLLNSGLARGSEAWDNATRDLAEREDTAYGDAMDRAVIGAEQQSQANQSNAFNRIIQALTMQRGGLAMPQSNNTGPMANVQGPDLLGATGAQFGAEVDRTNAINAQRAAPWNALTTLGSAFLMGRRA